LYLSYSNVGNSGGPLVDVESGDIVGINTCIRANMEGTSFAIPINRVMEILDDLCEGRHITHGYLGVQMSTMNPTLARYHNRLQSENGIQLPEMDGVMIEKVCLWTESHSSTNHILQTHQQPVSILESGIQKVTRRNGRTQKVRLCIRNRWSTSDQCR
jgi:S1-C subfamily serine protease